MKYQAKILVGALLIGAIHPAFGQISDTSVRYKKADLKREQSVMANVITDGSDDLRFASDLVAKGDLDFASNRLVDAAEKAAATTLLAKDHPAKCGQVLEGNFFVRREYHTSQLTNVFFGEIKPNLDQLHLGIRSLIGTEIKAADPELAQRLAEIVKVAFEYAETNSIPRDAKFDEGLKGLRQRVRETVEKHTAIDEDFPGRRDSSPGNVGGASPLASFGGVNSAAANRGVNAHPEGGRYGSGRPSSSPSGAQAGSPGAPGGHRQPSGFSGIAGGPDAGPGRTAAGLSGRSSPGQRSLSEDELNRIAEERARLLGSSGGIISRATPDSVVYPITNSRGILEREVEVRYKRDAKGKLDEEKINELDWRFKIVHDSANGVFRLIDRYADQENSLRKFDVKGWEITTPAQKVEKIAGPQLAYRFSEPGTYNIKALGKTLHTGFYYSTGYVHR